MAALDERAARLAELEDVAVAAFFNCTRRQSDGRFAFRHVWGAGSVGLGLASPRKGCARRIL
eukprot:350380-Prymnesium_polylepis.1